MTSASSRTDRNGHLIRLENVSKTFRMGEVRVDALREVSLDINRGELIVMVGPSGSGKTTILNLIGGLDTVTNGRLWFGDLEITRFTAAEVEADILTLDVVAAKVGDAVEIYGPAIGQPSVRGKVARIFPAGFTKVSSLGVEQQRVKVVIHFDDKDELKRLLRERGLGVGYRVRVRIFTADKSRAILIPRSALFRAADGKWQLFAVRNGRASLQTVEVGLMNDEQAEIRSGVAEGELVVLAPESSLTDGMRVDATQ
jgi:energy-coupling factor transporter ATP-binding protein EcfA2